MFPIPKIATFCNGTKGYSQVTEQNDLLVTVKVYC